MTRTTTEIAIPPAVMNGTPATTSPRIATTTMPPATTTGLPAVASAEADRLLDRHTASEVVTVPGHDEQRVVDADTQPDHGPEDRRPARDVDDVGDERHGADTDGEPEHGRADREGRGDQGTEGEEQDERRHEQADELAQAGLRLLEREEEVATHLDPQRRSGRRVGAERLEVAEVLRPRARPLSGYCSRIRATRPSADTDRAAPPPRDRRPAHRGSVVPRTWGRAAAPACSCASADRASGRVEERGVLGQRSHDHLGRQAGIACAGSGHQLARLLGVEPGHLQGVLQTVDRRRRKRPRRRRPGPATSRSRATGGGQTGGQDGTGTATSSVVLQIVGVDATAMSVSVATRRGDHIGRRGRRCPGRWKGERLVLSADAHRRAFPTLGS